MKKKLIHLIIPTMLIGIFAWSCSDESRMILEDNTPLSEFINSDYGKATLKQHGLNLSNLDTHQTTYEYIESKGITAINTPIIKGGKIIGRLNAFKISMDNSYRAIVEEWNSKNSNEYEVTLSTGEGIYLATVGISKKGNKTIQRFLRIADMENDFTPNSRSASESWWDCTARTYETFKQACNDSDSCDLLCDLIDVASTGKCTISMAAAAAYICL